MNIWIILGIIFGAAFFMVLILSLINIASESHRQEKQDYDELMRSQEREPQEGNIDGKNLEI